MSTQSAQITTFDYGPSLTSATLRDPTTDALVATADSVNEVGTDSGKYLAVFNEASPIAAGIYVLRGVFAGLPINRFVTLAGEDGELVFSRDEYSEGGLTVDQQAQLDAIQSQTDLIGSAAGATTLLAGAVLETGSITSFPETLKVGDSYTQAAGRSITVAIVNADGVPIDSAGTLQFADADAAFELKRSGDTEPSRIITGTVTVTDPVGTGTSEAPYAIIELSSSETSKGLLKYLYHGCVTFTWAGVGTSSPDEVISFRTGTVTFID